MNSAHQEGPCPAGAALCSVSLTAQQPGDPRRAARRPVPSPVSVSLSVCPYPVPLQDRAVSSLPCPCSSLRGWTSERGEGGQTPLPASRASGRRSGRRGRALRRVWPAVRECLFTCLLIMYFKVVKDYTGHTFVT